MSGGELARCRGGGTRRLTIRVMKVIIEPTDVFGIVYAILQIRRCDPLENESEDEHWKRAAERYVHAWCVPWEYDEAWSRGS